MEWTIIGVAIAMVAIAIVIFNGLVRMRDVVRITLHGLNQIGHQIGAARKRLPRRSRLEPGRSQVMIARGAREGWSGIDVQLRRTGKLFARKPSLVLDQVNHETLSSARDALSNGLEKA